MTDKWAEWLTVRRFGGDPDTRRQFLAELSARRDKILDLAELAAGESLLNVGCGEGLVGFGALDRGARQVTFSDVSKDLLESCRRAAIELGVVDRCRFVQAPANDLSAIDDASIDVVTTRSVLIYVRDKQGAFREFARVLRPGGRLSIFEPINTLARGPEMCWGGYDLSAVQDVGRKLRAVYEAIQPPDSDPMLDFDDRDLLRLAEEAGFFPLRLHLDVAMEPAAPRAWEGFLHSSRNPNVPTPAEAMEQALTVEERERLVEHLRPLVEQGQGVSRTAAVHLVGTKPEVTSR